MSCIGVIKADETDPLVCFIAVSFYQILPSMQAGLSPIAIENFAKDNCVFVYKLAVKYGYHFSWEAVGESDIGVLRLAKD